MNCVVLLYVLLLLSLLYIKGNPLLKNLHNILFSILEINKNKDILLYIRAFYNPHYTNLTMMPGFLTFDADISKLYYKYSVF